MMRGNRVEMLADLVNRKWAAVFPFPTLTPSNGASSCNLSHAAELFCVLQACCFDFNILSPKASALVPACRVANI